MALPRVLREMLALPTAAFVETAVLDYVCGMCGKMSHTDLSEDGHGNLLVRYRRQPPRKTRPLVFSAHTDHPGFVAHEMLDRRTLRAEFRGGVYVEYFDGAGVRFWSDGRWVRGRVLEVTRTKDVYRLIQKMRMPEEAIVRVAYAVSPGAPGMWDLPDPSLKGGKVYARGCDDIVGCAAMLALLERLVTKKVRAEVYCLFTRAEEVGFIGAIGAARDGTIPRGLPIVAIEASSARAGAGIGDGPVLRVGDKASIFTPGLTAFCGRVATELARRRKSFRFQRKLMDGGTCESTAYAVYGYDVTGICLALGNYHNMDTDKRRIALEYVSLNDWKRMVDWFEALVMDPAGYDGSAAGDALRRDFEKRFKDWQPVLHAATPERLRRTARPRRRKPALRLRDRAALRV